MSRIGNNPVAIPSGVTVGVTGGSVAVKGLKGELSAPLVSYITANVGEETVVFERANNSKGARANHGLMRALVQNMVTGVTSGFTKELEIIGVGYRAQMKGSTLVMQLGYSHPIEYSIPGGVTVKVDGTTNLTVTGISKQAVGQVAANIWDYWKPDHYKGKGVRYKGEYIRIKQGKA
jgi:large subunit ribosomal protein L6